MAMDCLDATPPEGETHAEQVAELAFRERAKKKIARLLPDVRRTFARRSE